MNNGFVIRIEDKNVPSWRSQKEHVAYWSRPLKKDDPNNNGQVCSLDVAKIYSKIDDAQAKIDRLLLDPNKNNWVHRHIFSIIPVKQHLYLDNVLLGKFTYEQWSEQIWPVFLRIFNVEHARFNYDYDGRKWNK